MRNIFYILLCLLLASCARNAEKTTTEAAAASPTPASQNPDNDYDGDGNPDEGTVALIKEGEGNPVEDGTPSEYAVSFRSNKLPQLHICCNALVVPEGDLNGDGAAEMSVFQAPMNGCVFTMATYTLQKGKWKELFEPFLVPAQCDAIDHEELKRLVFAKDGKVYIMETDVNDENFKRVPREVEF